jgi:hypothetical protein
VDFFESSNKMRKGGLETQGLLQSGETSATLTRS